MLARPTGVFQGPRLAPPPRTRSSRLLVRAAFNPHDVLGVAPSATEKEIKRAHRKLVLQHHPDLKKDGDIGDIQVKFLAIQEAYEILLGRRRGKEESAVQNAWDFHDWYWKFSMRRRQKSASAGAAAGAEANPPPPEVLRSQWKSQLSGLRQKAAAKAAVQARGRPAAARPVDTTAHVKEAVWRSTSKNARKATAPDTQAAFEQQRAGASFQAPRAATPLSPEQPRTSQQTARPSEDVPRASSFATAAAEDGLQQANDAMNEEAPSPNTASSPFPSFHLHTASPQIISMIESAALVVQGRHIHAHAQRTFSHIVSLGRKLSAKLRLRTLETATAGNGGGSSSGGQDASRQHWVPSEEDQRVLFGSGAAESYHHSHSFARFATSSFGESFSEPSSSHSPGAEGGFHFDDYPMDSHSRKFADRDHVKSRLSTQLSGLKRRAALKDDLVD